MFRPLLAILVLLTAGCAAPAAQTEEEPPALGAGPIELQYSVTPLARTSSTDTPVGPMSFGALGKAARGFVVRESGVAEHVHIAEDRSGAPYEPLVEAHGSRFERRENPAWLSKSAYLVSWSGTRNGDSILIDPYNKVIERTCDRGTSYRNMFGVLPASYKCGSPKSVDRTTVTFGSSGSFSWTPGYIRAAPFIATSPYVELFLQKADGLVAIEKLDPKTSTEIFRERWATDWDTFLPYVSGGKFHVLAYSSTTGRAALERFDATPDGKGLTRTGLWTQTWDAGWKGFAPMRVGDGLEYVACHPTREECVLDRIDAQGKLSTLARASVTFRTDDVKTLGPMPFTGDGTASMVVRNGQLWTEIRFWLDEAAAAKAREKRPTAHATFDVAGEGIRVHGKLLAASAAGADPVGPMSWVARGDLVTGYASMNAVAQQVVIVPKAGSQNGPPDAFKFPTFWGERYGGSRAYTTQLVTGTGTYEVFIDPYFPTYSTMDVDPSWLPKSGVDEIDRFRALASPEPWAQSMDVFIGIFEDPGGTRDRLHSHKELDPKTLITIRAPTGARQSILLEPGFIRASPLVLASWGTTEQYLLLQKTDRNVEIHRIILGTPGKLFETRKVYAEQWAEPWDTFRMFTAGGSWYLFSYASANGKAALDRIDFGDLNTVTLEPVWTEPWSKGWQGFAPISETDKKGSVYALASCNFTLGECAIDRFDPAMKVTPGPRVKTAGKIAPLNGLAPGYRSEWNEAHLIGWRGGTGWVEMTIASTA